MLTDLACNKRLHHVLDQAPGLHFNRGALLNVGALLLAGSEYDCLVFHDVDTVCGSHETVGALLCQTLCGRLWWVSPSATALPAVQAAEESRLRRLRAL